MLVNKICSINPLRPKRHSSIKNLLCKPLPPKHHLSTKWSQRKREGQRITFSLKCMFQSPPPHTFIQKLKKQCFMWPMSSTWDCQCKTSQKTYYLSPCTPSQIKILNELYFKYNFSQIQLLMWKKKAFIR